MKKKITALILIAVMIMSLLASCSKGGTGEEETPEYVYKATFTDFPESEIELDYISACHWCNGKFYIAAQYVTGTETAKNDDGSEYEYNTYDNGLFSLTDDGTEFKMLDYSPIEIPEGYEGSSSTQNMVVADDGTIWTLESLYTYTYDIPDDFDEETDNIWDYYVYGGEGYYIRHLDADGKELSQIDANELLGVGEDDYVYVSDLEVDSDGNLYLFKDQGVVVANSEGEKIFELETDSWINGTAKDADGNVCIMVYKYDEAREAGGYVVQKIDTAAQELGDAMKLPTDCYSLYQAGGDYEFYYVKNYSLYGLNLTSDTEDDETGETQLEGEKLFSFINIGVDSSNLNALAANSDGSLKAVSTSWDSSYENRINELVTIDLVKSSEVPKKTTLTYACMYVNYDIRRLILDFNKTNENYTIEVVTYSDYNTDDDPSAGLTKLTTEILSGNVPDIIGTSSMPVDRFAAKGYLEDLWPWIEQDSGFNGRESFVEPVFNAMSDDDGKLYEIAAEFEVYTVMGPSSIVGSEMGWTLDDLLEAYSKMPENADIFNIGQTKSDIMQMSIRLSIDNLVNWQTGECNFDSDEFINILKFADLFPEEFDWDEYYGDDYTYENDYTRFSTGKQMLMLTAIYNYEDFQYNEASMGGDATFVGYPSGTGNGSAFLTDSGLAMSSTCKNKEGAWEFMRTILTEEYQSANVWEFPTNKDLFDANLEEAMRVEYMTDPETGEQVEKPKTTYWVGDDMEIDILALTQEQADKILNLIDSTDSMYNYDDTLYDIIMDECGAFFAGQKTAEETAKLVQSRVSIYVNEQR